MLAREYNRKVSIYKDNEVSDGFGGYTNEPSFVGSFYAKIETNKGYTFKQFGIEAFVNPTIFKLRGIKNNVDYTENYFVRYNEKDYYIKAIENVHLDNMELALFCDEN